jgi:hypothetical protein
MLYELKVAVRGIDPPIWRLIQVPSRTSLKRLNKMLQTAMGWTDSHLHLFKVDGKQYGEPDPEWDYVLDEAKLTLEKIFAGGKKSFQYEYDLGDSWIHDITLKRQIESEETKAGCSAGARACPPEDCGSVPVTTIYLRLYQIPNMKSMRPCSSGWEKATTPRPLIRPPLTAR